MEDPKKKPKLDVSIKTPIQVSLAVLIMMAAAFTLAFGLLSSTLLRTTTNSTTSDSGTATTYYCGDANADNKVTSADVITLSQYLKGTGSYSPSPLDRVRLDGDGDVDNRDLLALLNYSFRGQGTLACPGGIKATGTPFFCGDVNDSKNVTSADLVTVAQYVDSGVAAISPMEAAKLDADLDIDAIDRDLISDCIFKQVGTLTCPGGDKLECGKSYKCGDVNNDGTITSADIILMTAHINGTGSLPVISAGKLDGDNDVDATDRWLLEDYVFHGGKSALTCPGGTSTAALAPASFLCGDVNNDKTINASDVTALTNFANGTGTVPVYKESANLNDDANVTLDDATVLMNCIFKNQGTLLCHGGTSFQCGF